MTHRDDLTLETLLERMPADPELWRIAGTATSPEEERELRAWVELTGLLGATCAEDAPDACRERLLRAVRESADGSGRADGSAGADVVPIGTVRTGRGRSAASSGPAHGRTVWTLAAVLGVCCLALAFFTGRWMEQRERIEEIVARSAPASLPAQIEENRRLEDRLRMVTTVARYAYPLQPTTAGGTAMGKAPDGVVYVCGAHQQWYLALNGLEPAPPGHEYRLWFLTEEGPRAGGRLEVDPGKLVELEASTLPRGTRGFSVSLEPSGGAADEPHGTMVLLSEDSVSL